MNECDYILTGACPYGLASLHMLCWGYGIELLPALNCHLHCVHACVRVYASVCVCRWTSLRSQYAACADSSTHYPQCRACSIIAHIFMLLSDMLSSQTALCTHPLKVQPIALEPPCNQLAVVYLDCLGSSMNSASQPVAAETSYQSRAEAMMEDNCYKVVIVSSVQCEAHCMHTLTYHLPPTRTNHPLVQSRSEKTLSFELLDIQVDLTEDLPETKVNNYIK